MFTKKRGFGRVLTATAMLAVLAVWGSFPAPARADFDQTLAEKVGPAVVQYLRDNGYHTVGVLKFRVKRGNEEESFYVGTLNDNMVTRLENALLHKSKDEDSLVFLQNPSAEAVKQNQHLSYLKPEGREKLLDISYPLAYGDEQQRVKPDALLTGLIELKLSEKKAALTVEAFGSKSKDLAKLGTWEVPLDRAILAEAGAGFSLPKPKFQTLGPADLNNAAADAVTEKKGEADAPIQVTILFNGQKQSISQQTGACGEHTVPDLKEGDKLAIRVKNISQEPIGLLMLVNGQSTVEKQQGLPVTLYRRWRLDPGDEETYEGYYFQNKNGTVTCKKFAILSDEESKKRMESEELNACNLGALEILVFREGKEVAAVDEEKPFTIGLRNKPTVRPKSVNEARSNINGLIKKSQLASLGGLIDQDKGNGTTEGVQETEKMKNPEMAMHMIIRYYHPKMKKLE